MAARNGKPTNDEGFTLVELMVIIVILGILAGIAFPTLFNQRRKGYRATMESDLRNAAAAQEAWATGHEGEYAAVADSLDEEGFDPSAGVVIHVERVDDEGFCLSASHANLGGESGSKLYYSTSGAAAGAPSESSCA